MKIVYETQEGWGVPHKSILVEKEDMPWDSVWEYSDDKNFKTAVMVALAYHRLVALKPETISKNDLMGYLGYGQNATRVKCFDRLNGVLKEIGFPEEEVAQAKPGTQIRNHLTLEVIESEEIKKLKKKKADEGESFVQLWPFVVHGLIKVALESKGMKLPDYLCVYLQLRLNMRTAYSKDHKRFLGFYGMTSLSRLQDRTGITPHTLGSMVVAMRDAGLIYKLSGKDVDPNGKDMWGANYYATSSDDRLIAIAKKEQQARANYRSDKKKHFVAARKGHGSSIFDQSIRDAVGVVNFQV